MKSSIDKSNYQIERYLQELLSEDVTSAKIREKSAFDRLVASFSESLVLFGAGGLGRKTLRGLRLEGIEPLAFADNNPDLWGRFVDGLGVLSPEDAARKYGGRAVFVVTIWGAASRHRLARTKQQLFDIGCSRVVSFGFMFWKYPDIFLPYYCLDIPHKVLKHAENVRRAFSLWADDESLYEYLAQLRWRMLLDFDGLPSPVAQEQYFVDDLFSLSPNEVFVDCGAFDGDTIRSFLHRQASSFGEIIALEPDPLNFRNLQEYISTLDDRIKEKVTLIEAAAGECKEKLSINVTGTPSSAIGSGTHAVDCAPLDDLLSDCVPTFIKMDIEGYELKALAGASKVIKQYNPILAVCVYHRPDHLWRIPLLIKSLADQYRFFLRSHGQEGWDLVCYAVPNNRLIFNLSKAVKEEDISKKSS